MYNILTTSFGEGFYAQAGDQHVIIPNDWVTVHDDAQSRPEWKPKVYPDENIYDADHAVGMHVRYNTHDAFLLRRLTVNPGADIRATCWNMLKSSGSDWHAAHGVQLGIDPTGAMDADAATVVWSDWYSTYMPEYKYGAWIKLEVRAVSSTGLVTVVWRTKNDWAEELAAAHLDLVIVDDLAGTPPPSNELVEIRDLAQVVVDRLTVLIAA